MAFQVIPSEVMPAGLDSDLFRKGTLDRLFGLGGQRVDDGIPLLFKRAHMDDRSVIEEAMAGLAHFQPWDVARAISYSAIEEMWKVTIGYHDWSNGIIFNRQVVRDERWSLVEKAIGEFGFMQKVTQQQEAVDWLEGDGVAENDAPQALANQSSMDNVPIFSASHPLSVRVGSPLYSNLIPGQASVDSVRKLLQAVRNTPNHLNVPGGYEPDQVVCHPNLMDEMAEILFSKERSDTPNNALNAFTRNWNVQLKSWPFLDDTEAVYAIDSKRHGLRYYTHMSLTTQVLTDPETWAKKYQAAYATGIGAIDWRGVAKLTGS